MSLTWTGTERARVASVPGGVAVRPGKVRLFSALLWRSFRRSRNPRSVAPQSGRKDEQEMEPQDVSVGPAGMLELTLPRATPYAVDPAGPASPHPPKQIEPDTVREALMERREQQEAEQSVIAEAREEASAAEPAEEGALTADGPPAE